MREIPFKAAIFDLDGTLLDSLYVWRRVDELFFEKRGMRVPENYGRDVAGMSYRETAEFTVERYLPGEDWQALIREWTEMAIYEYAHNVRMKPGALSYLRALKRAGVRLAVATAMTPELYTPCLENLGIVGLFDVLCSTEHTGGRGKAGGEVFLYAAEMLGVEPKDCAVFEDVVAGIRGAKAAGMRAYCVRDEHSFKDFPVLEAESDYSVDTLDDMAAIHDIPKQRRCVIFTAYVQGDVRDFYRSEPDDYVICADGGWRFAQAAGIMPDLVIGDFDSSEAPELECVETHPVMKDDTDTMLCIKRALDLGYEDIHIVGGMGGRLDHTLANLQALQFAALRHARVHMQDALAEVWVLRDGRLVVPGRESKLSLFALTDRCEGVTVKGTLYEVEDQVLVNSFPLGVSNEFASPMAEICVRTGTLLVICTNDR